ncbi:zinc finger CCCH-type antiviral protein 1-like [Dreissena polymorpha]|uniref:zinc finger CCCH-type antiviral protein 1-like n=1 Tax=Dreissena polymorpha TaxID=45954 RepID=UPI002264B9CB|nr:zinc finger CCCH-type antiviral protein 1-like [Dreissena polymorpha]
MDKNFVMARAPKNFRGPEDMKKVPTNPPYSAYIGNLSYQATEEDVQDFFGDSVKRVRLKEVDGKPRGYGFVEFNTRQALIDALDMNDEMFMNRNIRVDLAGESQQGGDRTDPSHTVPMRAMPRAPKTLRDPEDMKKVPKDPPFSAYIGNLSYQVTEEDVQDFFGDSVFRVRLIREDDGRPRGYGLVEFKTRQDLKDALAMNDEIFLNRKLKINVAESQQGHGPKFGTQYAGARPKTGPLKGVHLDSEVNDLKEKIGQIAEQLVQIKITIPETTTVAKTRRGVSPSRGAQRMFRSGSRTEISQEPVKDISQKYVCIHNLVGKCSYGFQCFNYHCKMPYQWMYKPMGSDDWREVQPDENLLMEDKYCNPSEEDYFLTVRGRLVKLDFLTMTTLGDHVLVFHRLSTNTSVVMDTQPLATKWIWYWKNQVGSWSKYGDDDHGYKTSLCSNEIEQAFINNPEGQLEFITAGHDYVLNFQEMVQCNLHYKIKRAIRRRPEFVDKREFEMRRKQEKTGYIETTDLADGSAGAGSESNIKAEQYYLTTINQVYNLCSRP